MNAHWNRKKNVALHTDLGVVQMNNNKSKWQPVYYTETKLYCWCDGAHGYFKISQ